MSATPGTDARLAETLAAWAAEHPAEIERINAYAAEAAERRQHGIELLATFTLAGLATLQDAIAAAIEVAAERDAGAAEALRDVDLRGLEDTACALRQAQERAGEPDDGREMQRLSGEQLGLRAA
jgi:hypothetical protein